MTSNPRLREAVERAEQAIAHTDEMLRLLNEPRDDEPNVAILLSDLRIIISAIQSRTEGK